MAAQSSLIASSGIRSWEYLARLCFLNTPPLAVRSLHVHEDICSSLESLDTYTPGASTIETPKSTYTAAISSTIHNAYQLEMLLGHSPASISAVRQFLNTSTATLRDFKPLIYADIITQAEKLHFALLGLQRWVESHDADSQQSPLLKSLNNLTLSCTNLVLYLETHASDFALDAAGKMKTGPKFEKLRGEKEIEELHEMLVHQSLAVGAFLKSAFLYERSRKEPDESISLDEAAQVTKILNSISQRKNEGSFAKQLTEKLSRLTSVFSSDTSKRKLIPSKGPCGSSSGPDTIVQSPENTSEDPAHRGTATMLWQTSQLRQNSKRFMLMLGSPWSGMDSECRLFEQTKAICASDASTQSRFMADYASLINLFVLESANDFLAFARLDVNKMGKIDNDEKSYSESRVKLKDQSTISFLDQANVLWVESLWNDDDLGVKFIASLKDALPFEICAAIIYFMDRLVTISKQDYIPTDRDILMYTTPRECSLSTTFFDLGDEFRVLQLSPLSHGIPDTSYFTNLLKNVNPYRRHVILYSINLAGYDLACPDDPENTNELQAELTQFKSLMRSQWCHPIILIFTGLTEFRRKLSWSPIKEHFPEYEGHVHSLLEGVAFFRNMFANATKEESSDSSIYVHYVMKEMTADILLDVLESVGEEFGRFIYRESGLV